MKRNSLLCGDGFWLQTFSYRIDINPLIFVGFGLGAMALSWVTVGGRAYRVALSKPVNALRYE